MLHNETSRREDISTLTESGISCPGGGAQQPNSQGKANDLGETTCKEIVSSNSILIVFSMTIFNCTISSTVMTDNALH